MENAASAINIRIKYRLGEYLSLIHSHALAEVARRKAKQGKAIGRIDSLLARGAVWLFGPPIFAFKVLKVGECSFAIDESGLVRQSKTGEMVLPWSSVVALHEYPVGYIIMKANGGLPIPFRVLTTEQRELLATYIKQQAGMTL
ncbi:YcxB family protein [Pseudoduganella sp. RAF53_2]|uniref:YcxB family protein n=1 Tax=unclassified Pseudoduganella TaxID=2637179 RepID=UPI003F99898D